MTSLLHKADTIIVNSAPDTECHLRPKFHISPPKGLLNDPNGFIEHNDQYHLFFQWNPFACNHGAKYWAHCVSTDLVHWEYHPTALAPDQDYDLHGCYSGSAFDLNGELYLFYTGNLKNDQGERFSTQCLAKATNTTNKVFTKLGPVIYQQPKGYTAHFRDPKIWQHDQKWYCVFGAQTIDLQGQVLLHSSDNAYDWECLGPIAGDNINGLSDFAYMFECPDLFSLNDRDVLIGCPQRNEQHENRIKTTHNNGYFIGDLDYQKKDYIHGSFRTLDQGFEFYAPQTTEDSKGRRLLSAWVGIPDENEQPTVETGWLHTLSLVRELKNNKIYQLPADEHKVLRKNRHKFKLPDSNNIVLETNNCYELEVCAKNIQKQFRVRLAEENDNYLSIVFDADTHTLTVERVCSQQKTKYRSFPLIKAEELKLQVFFDHSIIEVFINNGEEVFTSRVFPKENKSKVAIKTDNSCIITRLVIYDY